MPENAIEFINEVSNSPSASGRNQLLTAEAISNLLSSAVPSGPQVETFTNADLSEGILVVPYASGQAIVYYAMKDENDDDIKVPANYDEAGTNVTFDLSTLENPLNPGEYISGTWTLVLWTSTGPAGITPEPIIPGDNNTGRVRLEPPTGDVDLKVVDSHTIFVVETDTIFAPEELQVVLMEAVGVTSNAFISLNIVAGDTIIAAQSLPITQQYERYSIDISGFDVIPAGSVIRINVTTGGVALGNMIGRVYLFGYVDNIVL